MEIQNATTQAAKVLNFKAACEVNGVHELERVLREKITEYTETSTVIDGRKRKGSYRLLSEYTGISQAYIHQFHSDERAICITNMNKLANYFGVKYTVSNF